MAFEAVSRGSYPLPIAMFTEYTFFVETKKGEIVEVFYEVYDGVRYSLNTYLETYYKPTEISSQLNREINRGNPGINFDDISATECRQFWIEET